MTEAQLQNIFCYHKPTDEQTVKYEKINDAFLDCARVINDEMPAGPGHTVAIRKLNEARHAANAAVALEGTF